MPCRTMSRALFIASPRRGTSLKPTVSSRTRGMRDVVGGVDGNLAVVVGPEGRDAGHVEVFGRLAQDAGEVTPVDAVVVGGHRSVAEAILAEYLGGDALAQAVGVLWVEEQDSVRVGVGVDEARRDGEAGSVYNTARAGLGEVSNLGKMRSPSMPTSALKVGAPLPSATTPPEMITSNMCCLENRYHLLAVRSISQGRMRTQVLKRSGCCLRSLGGTPLPAPGLMRARE